MRLRALPGAGHGPARRGARLGASILAALLGLAVALGPPSSPVGAEGEVRGSFSVVRTGPVDSWQVYIPMVCFASEESWQIYIPIAQMPGARSQAKRPEVHLVIVQRGPKLSAASAVPLAPPAMPQARPALIGPTELVVPRADRILGTAMAVPLDRPLAAGIYPLPHLARAPMTEANGYPWPSPPGLNTGNVGPYPLPPPGVSYSGDNSYPPASPTDESVLTRWLRPVLERALAFFRR